MHGARPLREQRERHQRQGLQRGLLDLDEVRPHLAARRAVDAHPRDGAIPVLGDMRIVRGQAVEAPARQGIALHVAATALLLAVSLSCGRRG